MAFFSSMTLSEYSKPRQIFFLFIKYNTIILRDIFSCIMGDAWNYFRFPSINSIKLIKRLIFFSKKMYSGGMCSRWGEFMIFWVTSEWAEQPHLILLQMKLDYILNILPQTGCPAKFAFRLQRGSKLAKSAIFRIFFGFSNITGKPLNL